MPAPDGLVAPAAAAPTAVPPEVHTLAAAAATPATAAARNRSRLPKCKSIGISLRFMTALLKRMPPTEPRCQRIDGGCVDRQGRLPGLERPPDAAGRGAKLKTSRWVEALRWSEAERWRYCPDRAGSYPVA